MKILHTADLHLDSPLQGHGEDLRNALAAVPGKLLELCRAEGCDMVLIAGDVFDGTHTPYTAKKLREILAAMAVPVFITPGNHDFCSPDSPWKREIWPENVHIFDSPQIGSVVLPELDCRVYGAGFSMMDCPPLLEGFRAEGTERYAIGIFHGDALQSHSSYNPITRQQVQESGLDYLALGHIHKADSFVAGATLCAWPGCPMGRGYDEPGEKGAYIVTLDDRVTAEFRPLDTPRFYDLQVQPEQLGSVLPAVTNKDYYRITLTGCCEEPNLGTIKEAYAHIPKLVLRDTTTRPVDVWGSLGEDSFEGVYFGLLRQAMESAGEEEKREILLAAQISRQLMEGQEVVLP